MAINIRNAELEIRETRLSSITLYAGSAAGLVEASKQNALVETDRSFSQGMNCASSSAFCQLSMIKDCAVIVHGPVGCAGDTARFNFTYRAGQEWRGMESTSGRYFCSNLEEQDTVFGGARKLEASIRTVFEQIHPRAIFVTTSCASGIIGDDIESVVNPLSEELGIPVVGCYCEGFKSRLWTYGFDAAYHAIVRKIVKPPRSRERRINVINFFGSHVFDELLGSLGYAVDYIVPFSTLDQLERASEATLSISICSTLGTYLSAALEEVWGVPAMKSPPGFGLASSDEWYQELGEILGESQAVAAYIRAERERISVRLDELRAQLRGKTAYLSAGAAHGHAIIALLKELGIEVLGAAIFHHDPHYDNGCQRTDALEQVVRNYGDVPNYNVCNKQAYEVVNILNKLRPDIMIARHSGMTHWASRLGIPSLLIDDEQFGFGYQGLINYGERILEALDNREFLQNLAEHRAMPYTQWWLDQDPFHFRSKQAAHAASIQGGFQ